MTGHGPPGWAPPPAGGFGAGPPPRGFGPPQPPVPVPAPTSVVVPLRLIVRILAVVVGGPALAAVLYAIVTHEREKKNDVVVFDNRLDAPAEVVVDGKVIETIKPRSDFWIRPRVSLPSGAKKIVVTSKGAVVSEVALAIRPRAKEEAHGYRGLYVIGPSRDYVIAKIPYYAEEPDKPEPPVLVRLPRPTPLTELPRELETFEASSIDGPILESESMPRGVKMVWRTQLCTIDRSSVPAKLGCSGFPGEVP